MIVLKILLFSTVFTVCREFDIMGLISYGKRMRTVTLGSSDSINHEQSSIRTNADRNPTNMIIRYIVARELFQ